MIKKQKKAFTLTELLLATALLSILLLSILHLFLFCFTNTNESLDALLAYTEAYSKIEEIRSAEYNDIISTYNADVFNMQNITGTGTITAQYVADTDSSLISISIDSTYTDTNNRNINFIIASLVAKKS